MAQQKTIKETENAIEEISKHYKDAGLSQKEIDAIAPLNKQDEREVYGAKVNPIRIECMKSLECLYLATEYKVSDDVNYKVKAYIRQLEEDYSILQYKYSDSVTVALNEIEQSKLSSQEVNEDAVGFAEWISNNQFTCYNNIWTSTKIHYSPGNYSTKDLYAIFKERKARIDHSKGKL